MNKKVMSDRKIEVNVEYNLKDSYLQFDERADDEYITSCLGMEANMKWTATPS